MYNKIKNQNIKLNDIIYSVDLLNRNPNYVTHTVTGIVIDEEKNYDIYLDSSKTPKIFDPDNFYYTYSEIKAERMVDRLKKLIEKEEAKLKEQHAIRLENDKKLYDAEKKYLDKEVMIKIDSNSWIKARVWEVRSSYKKNVYYLTTIPKGSGEYLTSNEGKSWYFFSKEAEIKKQIEILQAQLKRLETEE